MTTADDPSAVDAAVAAEGWWAGLDRDVLACLASRGAASPADIAARLGISERAVCSVVSMLVCEGKIRISRVELARSPGGTPKRHVRVAQRVA